MPSAPTVDSTASTKLLPPDHLAFLKRRDLDAYDEHDGIFAIRDEDGILLFRVTIGISLYDLQQAVNHGYKQFNVGKEFGVQEIQAKARALFGVKD